MFLALAEAISLLKNEEVVAIPTETVYGLAGMATSALAVAKIYEAKRRPKDNPLICHFSEWEEVERERRKEGEKERMRGLELISKAFPQGGPVSLLLDLAEGSSLKAATCGLSTVICRVPAHELAREIIRGVGKPLAAPSANTSGSLSPISAEMVEADLGARIAGIVDGGRCDVGLESTIIDVREEGVVKVLRPGGLNFSDLAAIFEGWEIVAVESTSVTPGAKYRHYAPKSPVEVISSLEKMGEGVLVGLDEAIAPFEGKKIGLGGTREADRNFFRALDGADKLGGVIYILDSPLFSEAVRNRIAKMKNE